MNNTRTFKLVDSTCGNGVVVGGKLKERKNHVTTVALQGGEKVSVFFNSTSVEESIEDEIIDYSEVIHSMDSTFVSFVLNDGPQNWCDESLGILPKLEIVHMHSHQEELPKSYDEYCDLVEGEETIYEGHKIGGVPFYEQGDEDFVMQVMSKMKDGYEMLLQVSFPNPEDDVSDFNWPFCDMHFTLFARKGSEGYDFMCCWY